MVSVDDDRQNVTSPEPKYSAFNRVRAADNTPALVIQMISPLRLDSSERPIALPK